MRARLVSRRPDGEGWIRVSPSVLKQLGLLPGDAVAAGGTLGAPWALGAAAPLDPAGPLPVNPAWPAYASPDPMVTLSPACAAGVCANRTGSPPPLDAAQVWVVPLAQRVQPAAVVRARLLNDGGQGAARSPSSARLLKVRLMRRFVCGEGCTVELPGGSGRFEVVYAETAALRGQAAPPDAVLEVGPSTRVELVRDGPAPARAPPARGGPWAQPAARALSELLGLPLRARGPMARLGAGLPRGVMLHGASGVGKTWIARAVAADLGLPVVEVDAQALDLRGASLRAAFGRARDLAGGSGFGAAAVLLDGVDDVCPRRDRSSGRSQTLVAELLEAMDGVTARAAAGAPVSVVVLATATRPDDVDPALRRPGRLDRELLVGPPDRPVRLALLEEMAGSVPLDDRADLGWLAERAVGLVAADLAAVVREAARSAAADAGSVGRAHLERALRQVGASSRRGHEVVLPSVGWDEVAGLEDVKRCLRRLVEWPLQRADSMRRLGLESPRGVLLYGPPGCSKTTLVRCVATAARAAFLTVTGAEVNSSFVGEAERTVRAAFLRARANAPCVLFFDEFDSVVGSRGAAGTTAGESRLLAAFLTEMDGVQGGPAGVLVVAATNRPDMLDAALLRPGRLDYLLYVPPPDAAARQQILRLKLSRTPARQPDALQWAEEAAPRLRGYSGADLEAVCREAALCALRRGASEVERTDLEQAAATVGPSLTDAVLEEAERCHRAVRGSGS